MPQWIKNLNENDVKRDLATGFRYLRFSSPIEYVYQQYFHQWLLKRARPVGWISLIIFLCYSVLDYHLFPEFVSQWTIGIRLFFICPIILMVIWLCYQPVSNNLFFRIYSLGYFLAGLAIVAIIMAARLQQVYMPYDGLLLLLMFGYFVMGVPFFYVVVASWLIMLSYLAMGVFAGIASQEIIYNSFFLITANIIGGLGSYLQEKSQRRHFLGQLLLEFSHEKAKKESKLKTTLVATASHELRQPLHAMNLLAENLSDQLSNENQKSVMGRLQLSIKQLQDLLGSLFEISRLSVGVVKPRKKNIDCGSLIRMLVMEYQPRCRDAGIELVVKGDESLKVCTDPLLLTRILRNLLENAIKHSDASSLSFVLGLHNNQVEVVVEDNGVGIDDSQQREVFKEFNSLSRHGGGLGVGLAIVKQLADLLGISLSLKSSLGSGCVFTLILPRSNTPTGLNDAEFMSDSIDSLVAIKATPGGKRLMVVDDDLDILASMTSLMRGWGYDVIAFDNPEKALNSVVNEKPDVVIADYEYLNINDNFNGAELIGLLRLRANRTIPALLLSANTELGLEAKVDKNSIVAYKPLKPAKLKLIIQHLLDMAESVKPPVL